MNNKRAEELRHLRDKLKSGDYDGVDIMQAWIALEEYADLIDERAALQPTANPRNE